MNQIEKGIVGEEALSIASSTYLKYYVILTQRWIRNGKQICDLLILFRNVAIIIEIKIMSSKAITKR